MRIDEFTRPESVDDAFTAMEAKGYKKIGTGSVGWVYAKPGSKYAVKVFQAADVAYIRFTELARQHQDNPHFPRFFGKMIQVTPRYAAIRTELLAPAGGDMSDYLESYMTRRLDAAEGNPTNPDPDRLIEIFTFFPRLKEACDLVADTLGMKHRIDLHDENMMRRGSIPVLTDPITD